MKNKMQTNKEVYAISIMAFLVFSMVFAYMPMANAAGAITVNPTSQTPGVSVTIHGTGFGANQAAGIGFGAEVQVINEWMNITGPYDVGVGPYTAYATHVPIKPGTFRMVANITSTLWMELATDAGNGTLATVLPGSNATLDYISGKYTRFMGSPVSSSTHYKHLVNYTYYQYDATPAAGITTDPSGEFTASVVVPGVANGDYTVTAVDTQGNTATSSLSVANTASMWDKTYGGTNAELGYQNVLQTSDGGYIMTCDTNSSGMGLFDIYFVKTDAAGTVLWQKTYGGTLNESAGRFCKTIDGGYAIIGTTSSFGAGGTDVWLVKTDADGKALWTKTYGGAGNETGFSVYQTADRGYVLLACTGSFGAGGNDVWLIRTDLSGNALWTKTFGGAGDDEGSELILTSDGGYAIPSYSTSFGGFKTWLIKLNEFGNMVWNKTYSVGAFGYPVDGIQTADDGGYAITGFAYLAGSVDAILIKTDAAGTMLWVKNYGGTGSDGGWTVAQAADGGYVMVCETASFGAGGKDGWLIKTDADGNMLWDKTYGGSGEDSIDNFVQTTDGGYAIVGYTDSFGAGSTDLWLIKTDALGIVPEGLTIEIMLILSTIVVIAGIRYFRKRPKIEGLSKVKM